MKGKDCIFEKTERKKIEENSFFPMSIKTFATLEDSSEAEIFTCRICGNTYLDLKKVIKGVGGEGGGCKNI